MITRISIAVFVVLLISGCTRQELPKGIPDLYPAKIQVLQEGTPLAEADIELIGSDSQHGWPVAGRTGADGIADLVTYGKYKGAPVGDYKITVSKKEVIIDRKGLPELNPDGEPNPVTQTTFQLVENSYTQAGNTPLSCHIDKKNKLISIDAGKKIRQEIK